MLDGDRLTERGVIDIDGTAFPYLEVWQRATALGQTSPTSVIERDQCIVAIAVTTGEWMVVAHGDVERSGGWVLRSAADGIGERWTVVFGTSPRPIPLPDSARDVRWPWRDHA